MHAAGQVIEQTVTLRGRLHVVWNHETRYFLIDAEGRSTELLVEPLQIEGLGGPRAADGQQVEVRGTASDLATGAVRVDALKLQKRTPP
ncbi:MAG: hypothetical protein HY704_04100 [Gemmatimonadetes bacterium]|nr:hypothetical protein [Gemmatimonadota bacterium]